MAAVSAGARGFVCLDKQPSPGVSSPPHSDCGRILATPHADSGLERAASLELPHSAEEVHEEVAP